MSSGPQQTRIGNVDDRHRLTDVRRLCGQPDSGPSGVADQSMLRISSPISPPPASQFMSSLTDKAMGWAAGMGLDLTEENGDAAWRHAEARHRCTCCLMAKCMAKQPLLDHNLSSVGCRGAILQPRQTNH
jgi:hypothetical protein